ncbi:hypothetical protein OH77DRAFT_1440554 [Trametes cingulata]|nr:hypothetical protein OH77DRAFT_1440554 [Trametes cingulata]
MFAVAVQGAYNAHKLQNSEEVAEEGLDFSKSPGRLPLHRGFAVQRQAPKGLQIFAFGRLFSFTFVSQTMIPESEFVGSLAPKVPNYTTCIMYHFKTTVKLYVLRLSGKSCGISGWHNQNWAQKLRNTPKIGRTLGDFSQVPWALRARDKRQGTSNFGLLGAYFTVTMSPGLGTKSSILGLHEIQIKQNGVHLGAAQELYQMGWFIMCFSVT